MRNRPAVAGGRGVSWPEEGRGPAWFNAVMLLVWLLAGVVAFLPFALNTSPWDAVTLRVPGNQGNWWHVLVGAPFFLAYPMIWLRLRALFASQFSTTQGRRSLWSAIGLSIAATALVEVPFLLHLAGTSAWQRLSVLSLGFGVLILSAILLLLRRDRVFPTQACLIGIDAAYLANAALCLVVYSEAQGSIGSRVGWFLSMGIVWIILLDLGVLFVRAYRA
ncbi:hypothetical protein [Silvibacterium dinghuense]|uniref:DUF2306 domain-containing protein n=1 Tax=Silvibacterium dinghuense TaxID=1560006 RepID=A0A4Q1SIE4_9BACT|nr:hypothetical protein [Silvibacterium dinghuense]RXS97167.1 hypothetical protein ESZ00_04425 [Silvibacterium dinghuense]GGG96781.1 hypothetical protein GCM10011586_09980 [Silvibacterium dinghuense]